MIAAGVVFTLVAGVAGAGYFAVNHALSDIKRIPAFTRLDSVNRPVLPAATRHSMTILLTSSGLTPVKHQGHGVDGASTTPQEASGLIALLHFNANLKGGAVVSIPGNAEVTIPGHGRSELQNALSIGGPSLLIATVQKLTNVPIDHYAVINFQGLSGAIKQLGGVDVRLPAPASSGTVFFPAGVNHLTTATMLAYVAQSSLTEEGRILRQQAVLRAFMSKFVTRNLISDPLKDLSLLDALSSALSVDSNFTNAGLLTLSGNLHLLRPSSSAFVAAPVKSSAAAGIAVQLNLSVAGKLWQAIRNDSVQAFAKKFPATVTPAAPY
jgi:LCP family protein required for cell wall assembly